jgi:hypothetical protein
LQVSSHSHNHHHSLKAATLAPFVKAFNLREV